MSDDQPAACRLRAFGPPHPARCPWACLQAWHNGRWRHTLTEHRIAMALQLDRHGWLRPAPGVTLMPSPNRDARPPARRCRCWCCTTSACPGPLRRAGSGQPVPEPARLRVASLAGAAARPARVGALLHPPRRRRDPVRVHRGPRLARRRALRGPGTLQRLFHRHRAGGHRHPALRRRPVPGPAPAGAALRARYPLAAAWGHEHIAPGRKTDPGPAFNWTRFGRENGFARRQLPPA